MEPRSKQEVVRDIEENRDDVRSALRGTRHALTGGNPAFRVWRRTKHAAIETKNRISAKALETKVKIRVRGEQADMAIRENVYRSLAIALCFGTFLGFLAKRKFEARRRSRR